MSKKLARLLICLFICLSIGSLAPITLGATAQLRAPVGNPHLGQAQADPPSPPTGSARRSVPAAQGGWAAQAGRAAQTRNAAASAWRQRPRRSLRKLAPAHSTTGRPATDHPRPLESRASSAEIESSWLLHGSYATWGSDEHRARAPSGVGR